MNVIFDGSCSIVFFLVSSCCHNFVRRFAVNTAIILKTYEILSLTVFWMLILQNFSNNPLMKHLHARIIQLIHVGINEISKMIHFTLYYHRRFTTSVSNRGLCRHNDEKRIYQAIKCCLHVVMNDASKQCQKKV